ncbi:hypothetical protein Goklo_018593 [Gossypium klotzschianum]|uniref:Uncharacterized protein n=1 Tax=Gossypium klotzschianum TaxID=34286 RepID=A0A7J8ULA8_9ROSI|nr:hypothetical protein [Gossypium klotzschianum]
MGFLEEFILRVTPVGFFMFLEDDYKLRVLVIVARLISLGFYALWVSPVMVQFEELTSTLPAFCVFGKASISIPLCVEKLSSYFGTDGKPIVEPINASVRRYQLMEDTNVKQGRGRDQRGLAETMKTDLTITECIDGLNKVFFNLIHMPGLL